MIRAVLLAIGLVWGASANADIYRFSVILDQAQEVPAPSSVPFAFGNGTLFYDDVADSLAWFITYGLVSGMPIDAHIHVGAPGVPGPVVLSLGPPTPLVVDGTFGNYFFGGALPAAFEDDLFAEDLYANIHTAANPLGEIRGQILFHSVVVPVPPAMVLLASACGLLTWRRGRRSESVSIA